jgi:uncharacterized membrane protein
MKAKAAYHFLFLGGCISLIALWAWALADGVRFLTVGIAIATTALLCFASSAVATKKIKEDSRVSIGDVAATGMMIAVAAAAIGACVFIWEYVPGRHGHGHHLDRRYSLLFFAIAAHLLLFPFLSSRKTK